MSADASIQVGDVISLQVILEMVINHLHFLLTTGKVNRVRRIGHRDKEEEGRIQHVFGND